MPFENLKKVISPVFSIALHIELHPAPILYFLQYDALLFTFYASFIILGKTTSILSAKICARIL